ncbi:MATE family efflux transporter, partial [Clostridium botulinum]|nr:MATE family efflux transporter [Clostridium botulinum]
MKRIDLTKGKVISVLTALAIPIMGSSLLQFTYNLIDMLWVGRLGSNAVASIGSSSFYIGLGYSINALVIIGCGIKVAHAIGEKDDRNIKEYINAGLFINLIIGFIFIVSIIFLGKNFINYLNLNNPIVERDSYTYLLISGPTMVIAFFNLLYARILGSFGNNKLAFN